MTRSDWLEHDAAHIGWNPLRTPHTRPRSSPVLPENESFPPEISNTNRTAEGTAQKHIARKPHVHRTTNRSAPSRQFRQSVVKHLATSASLRHQKSTCTRGRTPRTHTSSADPSRIGTKYSLQRRMHQNETDSYAKHTNTVPLTARTQNPSRFPQRSTSALFFVFYTCPENSRTISRRPNARDH
eukprot:jgi/Phyca11/574666/estExt2_Genewise1.C_PHYCAscaffold_640213